MSWKLYGERSATGVFRADQSCFPYYCDDEFECDPHKEVEVFEYQVENLLAILSLWGRYDIFSKSLGQSSDCNRFET